MWRFRAKATSCCATERGQVLPLFALGLVAMIGLVALSIDVGRVVHTRTDLQKTADAAAFAAAQDLPHEQAVRDAAAHYVAANVGGDVVTDVTVSTGGAPSVSVHVARRVDYTFGRVVGVDGSDVSARATVSVAAYAGGVGMVPLGLIASNESGSTLLQNDCYQGLAENGNPLFEGHRECTLKYGAGVKPDGQGDFGALAIDATGASEYAESLSYGSNTMLRRGDTVGAQTGNMQGKTREGITNRLDTAPPVGCASNNRSDVLIDNPDGTVSIRPGCEHSPRLMVIPVVDQINNPEQSLILGFAFMFLTGTTNQGGDLQVSGEFVQFVTELPGAVYEGSGEGASALKLVD